VRGAPDVTVIGGGLAGCEASWQLAERGARVVLVEMKPAAISAAHQTPLLCELVCSNSLRSDDPSTGPGLLKAELRRAGSMVIACADRHRVPAGEALAVERFGFGRTVTARLAAHPRIRIERRVPERLPDGLTILATGPLTAGTVAREVRALCGRGLYFYDAIAPIVEADTVDAACSFRASRWEDGAAGGDYLNCPMSESEYRAFIAEILAARKVLPHTFEEPRYFEGCMPIEVMAERGEMTLAFGPMRPVGLTDPRNGRRPFAVVQLRPENEYGTSYNLVGFQTRLAYPEQKRIFRMIPALREAEFLRFGSIHRNAYVESPRVLGPTLELRARPTLRLAGQITGVEGYIESCAMGLLAALYTWGALNGVAVPTPPPTTALGGLHHHVTAPRESGAAFAPSNINFGLLPPVVMRGPKTARRTAASDRALRDLGPWLDAVRLVADGVRVA
jgi:methylenetetrahydrofolate--tRNA-(uracil-5-)-methyltransferase